MAVGDVRKVSPEEIQKVKNLIEKCISEHMKKNQVIDSLYQQRNIEPTFTKLVWERLEEENQEFFQAYYLRLMVKDQIDRYNEIIERHVALSHQLINPHGVVANESVHHIPQMHDHNASCYAPENNGGMDAMKAENMQQLAFPAVFHGGYNDGGPYIPSEMHHGPLSMALGQNLNGLAVTGSTGCDDSANAGATLKSHPPAVSSFGIVDSIPHHHQSIGIFMNDTHSSQLLQQFSQHDITQPHHFTNTTTTGILLSDTQRFPTSTCDPYFSGVVNVTTNSGFQNFGRDLYNNH